MLNDLFDLAQCYFDLHSCLEWGKATVATKRVIGMKRGDFVS